MSNAINIYVSATGSDDNDGTEGSPVKTIEKAQEIVRKYNKESSVVVNVANGEYKIEDSIKFTAEDGGQGNFGVSYVGDNAVLTGGAEIANWTLFDSKNNIYKASADFDFAQLYVNGEKAVRAKSVPIDDTYSMRIIKAYRDETTEDGVTYPANSITLDKNAVGKWSNLKDVKLKLLMAWTDNTLPIESIEYIGDRAVVKIQEPASERIFNRPHPDIAGYAGVEKFVGWFENAYEFIDEDNEWYLDNHTNTVYYKAPKNVDMISATVVAPKTETLVSIEGSEKNPVQNLSFSGIDFCYTTWTTPNEEGLVGGQASQYVLTSNLDNEIGVYRTPSAVYLAWCENVDFLSNRFYNIGATALDYHYGCKNGLVEGNTITDVSGNGINIGKFVCDDLHDFHDAYNPKNKNEICDGQIVRNNYIARVGTDYEGSCGIAGGYPRNLTIEYNTMSYMPYTAISVGYGWTNKNNAMKGNIIRYNNIHDVCLSVCDGAAIYTLSKQPKSEIYENYLHDFNRHIWFDYDCAGIYLDEQTDGYDIHDNVMINCAGVWAHNTGKINLEHNEEFYDESIIMNSGVTKDFQDILPKDEIVVMPEAPIDMTNWTATAFNTNDGASTQDALNFDSNTRWISGADQEVGSWFEIDMQNEISISSFEFTGNYGSNPDFPSDCDVMLSTDGENWETIKHISNNTELTIKAEFNKTKARYIKIVVTKAKSAWWDIKTVRVY